MASAPILNRVAPESRQRLLTPVGAEAASALRQMGGNKLLRPVMSDQAVSELTSAGFVRQSLGGPVLTDSGQIRAMMENGQ